MSTTVHQWQPGNGTNYDITIVVDGDGIVLMCWMKHGGSGGVCMKFPRGSYLFWDYMSEKMGTNAADTAAMLALVRGLGLAEVGMPSGYGSDGCLEDPRAISSGAPADRC